jgi:hypothetical protein
MKIRPLFKHARKHLRIQFSQNHLQCSNNLDALSEEAPLLGKGGFINCKYMILNDIMIKNS